MYTLARLAAGSYDLELDGEVIGGLVRIRGTPIRWCAELLTTDTGAPKPPPFDALEHFFPTFEDALQWLGNPKVRQPASKR